MLCFYECLFARCVFMNFDSNSYTCNRLMSNAENKNGSSSKRTACRFKKLIIKLFKPKPNPKYSTTKINYSHFARMSIIVIARCFIVVVVVVVNTFRCYDIVWRIDRCACVSNVANERSGQRQRQRLQRITEDRY